MNAIAAPRFPVINVLGYVVMIFAVTMLVPLGSRSSAVDEALRTTTSPC